MALTTVRRAGLVGQAGNIIQMQYTQLSATSSISSATDTDTEISVLAVNIAAPAAGSRKVGILLGTGLTYESSDSSSTPEQANYMYFDTPSTTSQVTYKVGFNHSQSGTIDWHLNKCVTDSDNVNQERGVSSICVTEIAG